MSGPKRHLVIMTKAPVAGRVKTRLGKQLGVVAATRFARTNTERVLRRLSRDRRWQTVLAVSPDTAVNSPFWPADISRMCQGGGDLGTRMQRLFDNLPPGPAIIVGTDIPGIRPCHIASAFARMGDHDAVFGPAGDGGYWLVGLRRRPTIPRPFADVRWSSPHALADSCRNLSDRRIAMIDTLDDVDTAEDYRAWRRREG